MFVISLQQGPLDVLIVDDRLLDGTGEIAEQLALLFPGRVDIHHQPGILGAKAAYTAGLRYALPVDCNNHTGYGGETGWPTYSDMVVGTNPTTSSFNLVFPPDGTDVIIDLVTQNQSVG